jgi:hypothetical protein
MVGLTFPTVLDRLGNWFVAESPLFSSGTPGDRARFFDRDALRDGAGDGCESWTGMCVIFFPRRVCVVATSNRSDFDLESLILGIERVAYGGMVAQCSRKMEMSYRSWNQFKVFESSAKVPSLSYLSWKSSGQGCNLGRCIGNMCWA